MYNSDLKSKQANLFGTAESLHCFVQVRAVLGGPKGSKEVAALSDDETIEKCLNEVEAALNAGLNFKGKFNSGLQVLGPAAAAVNTAFNYHVFA